MQSYCYFYESTSLELSPLLFHFSKKITVDLDFKISITLSPNYTDYSFFIWQDLETNRVVLVHGGGFGAWCWYKTISLLEEAGFKADAVDLTGSGIHYSDTNGIRNLAEYVKPLSDIFYKLGEGDKVCALPFQ